MKQPAFILGERDGNRTAIDLAHTPETKSSGLTKLGAHTAYLNAVVNWEGDMEPEPDPFLLHRLDWVLAALNACVGMTLKELDAGVAPAWQVEDATRVAQDLNAELDAMSTGVVRLWLSGQPMPEDLLRSAIKRKFS